MMMRWDRCGLIDWAISGSLLLSLKRYGCMDRPVDVHVAGVVPPKDGRTIR
jgi:hypothetical protein